MYVGSILFLKSVNKATFANLDLFDFPLAKSWELYVILSGTCGPAKNNLNDMLNGQKYPQIVGRGASPSNLSKKLKIIDIEDLEAIHTGISS